MKSAKFFLPLKKSGQSFRFFSCMGAKRYLKIYINYSKYSFAMREVLYG